MTKKKEKPKTREDLRQLLLKVWGAEQWEKDENIFFLHGHTLIITPDNENGGYKIDEL